MTRYKYERVIVADVFVSSSTQVTIVDGRVNMTVDVPAVNEGQQVTYRVWGVDSSNNAADASYGISLIGPTPENVQINSGSVHIRRPAGKGEGCYLDV